MRSLYIIVIGSIVSGVGGVLSIISPVVGVILNLGGALIAIWAAFRQDQESKAYTLDFTQESWRTNQHEGGYEIVVPHSSHKKHGPHVTVFQLMADGGYEVVMTDEIVRENNDVVVRVVILFAGRLQIK